MTNRFFLGNFFLTLFKKTSNNPIKNWAGVLDLTEDTQKHIKPIKEQLESNKPHEDDYLFFKNFPTCLMLDIGANAGSSAISTYIVNKKIKVISFEPNVLLKRILECVKGLIPSYKYYMFGLSPKECFTNLYIPVVDNAYITPLASMDKSIYSRKQDKERLKSFSQDGTFKIATIKTQFKKLDSLNLTPRIIKIDAEESELDILYGGEETIIKHKPVLMIENNSKTTKIDKYLSKIGYTKWCYNKKLNLLIKPSNKISSCNSFYVYKNDTILKKYSQNPKKDF